MNNKGMSGIMIVGIILTILLVWGLIGGNASQPVGVTCDFGLGEQHNLCWKWHTNALGQAQEAIEDFLNK